MALRPAEGDEVHVGQVGNLVGNLRADWQSVPASCARLMTFNGALVTSGMKYPVALTQTEEGYSVCCPALPGCWSQGITEEEALANVREAIQAYLEVARQLSAGLSPEQFRKLL